MTDYREYRKMRVEEDVDVAKKLLKAYGFEPIERDEINPDWYDVAVIECYCDDWVVKVGRKKSRLGQRLFWETVADFNTFAGAYYFAENCAKIIIEKSNDGTLV